MLVRLSFVAIPLLMLACTCAAGGPQPAAMAPVIEPADSAGLQAPSRLAAMTVPQTPSAFLECRLLYGAYGMEQFPGRRVTADLHQALLEPTGDSAEDCARLVFCFNMADYAGAPEFRLDWAGAAPDNSRVFYGLGDFSRDRWRWFSPAESSLVLDELEPYIDADNRLLLAVVLTGPGPAVLDKIVIGRDVVVAGVPICEVLAPPLEFEVQAVWDDYAGRNPVAQDFLIKGEYAGAGGFRHLAISHTVDGYTHYGGVRIPPGAGPGECPVMIYGHPGTAGASVWDGALFDDLVADPTVSSRFIVLSPTFRGEALFTDGLGALRSTGPASLYDRDADDMIAMLDAVLANIPEADPDLVLAFGYSRGAQVAIRAAERDPRIKGVVSYCGFTDEFMRDSQAYMYYALPEVEDTPPGQGNLYFYSLWDLRYGTGDVWANRRRLLMTSTAYFADRLPRVQMHHGALDDAIPYRHSERLSTILSALGLPVEYFLYPEGKHDMFKDDGGGDRLREFAQSFLALYDAAD